ncbi:phosphatase PAP2 family protein [Streptomyces sp. H39-S7]|nr:phosphatase PAP2 family protein [Streptomyces sp. H39-S7]MCZ4124035.1 phosphatase PAP2 family protein [Streptomyces sp. H39-S7]
MSPSDVDGPRFVGVWRLPAGLVLVCGSLLAALVAATATAHGGPFAVDSTVHAWVLGHRPPWVRGLAVGVTVTGSGAPAYVLAALAGALAARRGWSRGGLLGVVALASAQVPRIVLASALARPRPPMADWAWSANGWAMPSGHTATSMVVAVLLTVAAHRRAHTRLRPALLALPGTWAAAVGVSRVVLGVHWPTDVLAGWLLAACWAGLAALVVVLPRRRKTGAVASMERQRP